MTWQKTEVIADPFPFVVGQVRLAYPGWLNGEYAKHDPRSEFASVVWKEEE